jgi:tetratricopeptide (TPR) repeat protein
VNGRVVRTRWQRNQTAYGPAVFDALSAKETLAEAETALRAGNAPKAEATYLRALGKLGPFADPMWRSDAATDARTKSQCHARLAALAFDQREFTRSLRQTAAAASARRSAIALDQASGDDVRFMITALVHAATVHEQLGQRDEATRSCQVALEFSDFSVTQEFPPKTQRSIATARRAAIRMLDELEQRPPADPATIPAPPVDEQPIDLSALYEPPPLHLDPLDLAQLERAAAPARHPSVPRDKSADTIDDEPDDEPVVDLTVIDLRTPSERLDGTMRSLDGEGLDLEAVTAPSTHDDVTAGRHDDVDDDLADERFERDAERYRARVARSSAASADHPYPHADRPERSSERRVLEPAATLLDRARAQAAQARRLLAEGDSGAVIHAHRAVRTATRARPFAKQDEYTTIQVALVLTHVLVTRGDVLLAAGNDEGARADLRRAVSIAEQLWHASPSTGSARAGVLAATRGAALEWDRDERSVEAHLELAARIVTDADALGVVLPGELVVFESSSEAAPSAAELMALGDHILEALAERDDALAAG